MRLHILLLSYILFLPVALTAQDNLSDSVLSASPGKALTIIALTGSRDIESQFNKGIPTPDDYFNVELSNKVLKPLDENLLENAENELFSEQEINVLLNNNKIGQQILSYWFARQSDGSFDLETIQEKQLLDIHEIVALLHQSNKKQVSPEMVEGVGIVNETYIIMTDFRDIPIRIEYDDEMKIEDDNGILGTFILDFNYYLIKLDFNNSVASHFFNSHFITESTGNYMDRKQDFVTADFPFVLIAAKSDQVATAKQIQLKDDKIALEDRLKEEILGQLVELAVDRSVLNTKNESVFYKHSRIQGVKPLVASMGLKEGLKFDQRYSVNNNKINSTGKVEKKRVGIVKSMKIADNRLANKGENELSEFYQIGGGKISDSGMYLQEKKDLGINVGFDRSLTGPINTSGRIEYYFSKLLDGTIRPGKNARGMTSVKIYLEGGHNEGTFFIEDRYRKFEFVRGSIGISKDFYPLRFLHWSPFAGYGIESATWKGSDNTISTNYIDAGIRLGINIFHNIQLIATAKNNIIVNSVLLDAEREVLNDNFDYAQTFSNRKGVSFGLGVRIML